jgi:hypothetical protein
MPIFANTSFVALQAPCALGFADPNPAAKLRR